MSRNLKVGLFLAGGFALFCVGLFLIGSRAQLFGHYFTVYAEFKNIDTLQTGAKVRVSGMDAGEITGVEVPKNPSSKFRLKLKVDQKLHPIVRQDSLASIETEGMVGNKFVNIAIGSDKSPECTGGCTLPSQESVSTGKLMREASDLAGTIHSTIADIQNRADSALQSIDDASAHADKMIQQTGPNVAHITQNADAIVAGMRNGQGTAGKLLTDKTVAANVEKTIADAKQSAANLNAMTAALQKQDLPKVDKTLANMQDSTHKIDQAVGTFLATGNHNEGTAAALRDAAHGAQQATENLADDTEAIKHNFFFRGFFKRRGFYSLDTITPSKYDSSAFVKKPKVRVWVPAAGLFAKGSDGPLQLTDTGKAILDQHMSDLAPYLPNNPVVVEGYASAGLPDAQYVASRARAMVVRQYLDTHFHLNPKRVGAIGLRNDPPKGTGKQQWDGVALVLVVSKRQ